MSRKNISLSNSIEGRAAAIIKKRGMDGLSDLIAVLVREEFERRGLDQHALQEDHTPYDTGSQKPNSIDQVDEEIESAILDENKQKPGKPKSSEPPK